MAEADCALCEAAGYRSCDRCGNPVFPGARGAAFGVDLCEYCQPDGAGDSGAAEGPAASGASGAAATPEHARRTD